MSEDALATLRSEKIGFIFQSFHLIPSLTAFENVLIPMEILGLKDAKSRAPKTARRRRTDNRGHHYPTELSGGEQQRIAIARAFANSRKSCSPTSRPEISIQKTVAYFRFDDRTCT
jgi:putative ABC transport system ATP-binding protein